MQHEKVLNRNEVIKCLGAITVETLNLQSRGCKFHFRFKYNYCNDG